MVILNVKNESKETAFLLFDSSQRIYDLRNNYHIPLVTARVAEELEVHFLERHLVDFLTQDLFLVEISTEHFIPRDVMSHTKLQHHI